MDGVSTLPDLYFIRHGETEWSMWGRHTGRTDISLTQHGEEEARALSPRRRDISFAHVLTSPSKRARQTFELAGLDNCADIEPDLSEWNYGDYEGKRTADIWKTRSGWDLYRDGCPGGETPAQVEERVDRLIASLCKLQGNVALFSHGQFGCAFGARWIGLPVLQGQHFQLGAASLSILGFDPHHVEMPVIVLWNGSALEAHG